MNVGVAVGNLGFSVGRLIGPEEHAALVYAVGEAAEALGFHSLWVGDHLALPRSPSTPYPYGPSPTMVPAETSMLEPFAVLGALAGRTRRVRLGLGVMVAPYRPPLVAAKLISSLDALSGGRIIVGVGTGWMPEEFTALGADFARRGRDTDACLAFLVEAFARGEVDGMTLLPTPVQRPRPPLLIGGSSTAALRRAVTFGDAWDAPYADPTELRQGLRRLARACEAAGRAPATLGVSVRGIPAASLDAALLEEYEKLGVTDIGVTLPYGDQSGSLETLEQLAHRCRPALER